LAESLPSPGVYIIDGCKKPCTIRQWSPFDATENESGYRSIVDESFFLKRMGTPKISGRKQNETNHVRFPEVSVSEQPNKVVTNIDSDKGLLITEDEVGLVDSQEQIYNKQIIDLFNEYVSSLDKYDDKDKWSLGLSMALLGHKSFWNRSSSGLKYIVENRLNKIFPNESGLSSVITSGEFYKVLSWKQQLENKAKTIKNISEFKAWSTEFLTNIKYGGLSQSSQSYLETKLNNFYQELVTQ